jgi:hypothetical protein
MYIKITIEFKLRKPVLTNYWKISEWLLNTKWYSPYFRYDAEDIM